MRLFSSGLVRGWDGNELVVRTREMLDECQRDGVVVRNGFIQVPAGRRLADEGITPGPIANGCKQLFS